MPTYGEGFLDAETADYINNAQDTELLSLHRQLSSQVFSQVTRMGMDQKKVANSFDREVGNRMFFLQDGSDLTKQSKKSLEVAQRRARSQSESIFRRRTDFAATASAVNYARSISTVLQNRGVAVSTGRLEEVARQVAQSRQVRFGTTRDKLIEGVMRRHDERLQKLIKEQTGGDQPAVDRRLNAQDRIQSAGAVGIYGTPTKGGSLLKDMGRVLASEALADTYDTGREILKVTGLQFGYRRGVGGRSSGGRADVCDDLNTAVFDGIHEMLRASGFEPADLDLRGLYPVNAIPDYPHAFCRCWIEPLFA